MVGQRRSATDIVEIDSVFYAPMKMITVKFNCGTGSQPASRIGIIMGSIAQGWSVRMSLGRLALIVSQWSGCWR